MTNELSKALLKENGLEQGTIRQQSLDDLNRRLVRIRARARRMKWRAVISWIVFAICYIGYVAYSRSTGNFGTEPTASGYFGVICMLLSIIALPAAVVLTVSSYALSRGASLSEINVRLAHLEKVLTETHDKAS